MANRSDWLTVVVALCAFSFAAAGQTSLVLSSGSATPGGTASLPLSLANSGGTQPAGLQWTLNYPSSSISGITVTAGPASTTAAKTIYCAGSGGTYTCLAAGLNSNVIGDGVVANVQLTLTTSATSANITLSNALWASLPGVAMPVSTTGATLTVVPLAPVLTSLTCNPASLQSQQNSSCSVSLSANAGVGGVTVNLSSNLPTLTIPVSVTVPASASSATFTASAGTLAADQSATITATYNSSSANASVNLVAPVLLASLACTPASLGPNSATTCTVTLTKAAPTGGATVTLSNPNPTLTVAASVTVAAAATSGSFSATTAAITSDQSATITASLTGVSKTATLSLVVPVVLSSLQCTATALTASASTTCTVTLSKAAPASGSVVALSDDSASLTVPTSVTVHAGFTSADFSATTRNITSDQSATITASLAGVSKTAALSLIAPVALSSLQCATTTLSANANTICTVTLSKVAPASGDVSISSDRDAVQVPSSVPIRSGQSRLRFEVTVAPDARQGTATIEAGLGGSSIRGTVVVVPSGAPYLNAPAMQFIKPRVAMRFKVTATDSQDLPVTLSVVGLPKGATFDVSTGAFEWTPSDKGVYELVFTATNSVGGVSRRPVTLDVDSGNPVLTSLLNGVGKSALPACSPGAIAGLTGKWLSTASPISEPSGTLTEVGGTRVLVNGTYAQVLGTSGTQVDFLCPAVPPRTALGMTVETAIGRSNTIHTVMQETAPGVFLADPERGQALATFANSSDMVAVASVTFRGQPAVAGDAITIRTTGITCSGNSNNQPPRIKVGPTYAAIRSIETAPQHAGACEITFAVPASLPFGDAVPVMLEVARSDGTSIASNSGSIAIEIRP